MAVCLALAFAEAARGQDQVSDSAAKSPDWARRDSIRAESARPQWTSCARLPADFFPKGNGPIGVFTGCETLRMPLPRFAHAGTEIEVGNWRGFVATDSEGDRTGVTFVLPATGVTDPDAALTLRCRAGQLDAFVVVQRPLDFAEYVEVWLGAERRQFQGWAGGLGGNTLRLYGDQASVKAFVREASSYTYLAIKARPRQGARRVFTFDLSGIEIVSAQLLAACK